MTKRARAIRKTTEHLTVLRSAIYRPAPFPWMGVLVGFGVIGLLALATAPRNRP